jgi:accessory gene regulator protein AgrB
MTNAIKVLLQMQSGFLHLESTRYTYLPKNTIFCLVFLVIFLFSMHFFQQKLRFSCYVWLTFFK